HKSMKYFDENWRYATYIGAAIILIFSLALGFALGKYRVVLPYIVPSGNATRINGTPWTLFNQPWLIPHASSASLTDTIIGLGIVIALAPVIYVSWNNFRYVKSVEKNIPRFLRDILESTDSGVTLPAALIRASTSDYGPISREIGISMTKFSLGYDFRNSVMEAAKKLKHPYMLQVGLIIVEAYSAGGKTHDVLNSSVVLFNGLEQYTEEKQSELRPYTQLVYISVIIFLVIAFIITSQFIAPLNKLPVAQGAPGLGAAGAGHSSITLSKISSVYFESIFFIAGLFESLFGGIVAGKIVDGSATAGLRHSLIMLVITIVMFNAPGIGIFSVS
ncbi:MAG: type II secretion system F family protein, partial [Thaumarchaeota archaeon]|nr:type II secretion system F family protein [Nitrososphaerota archaeon]